VILDISLADGHGFDFLKQIRTFSDVPVIIVSVKADEVSRVKGLELGADDYITKPFSPLELLDKVSEVLGPEAFI
jgi:DNA-binding response OmpR family regulator